MTSADIQAVFNSVSEEVLKNFNETLSQRLDEKRKRHFGDKRTGSAEELARFAYTAALTDAIAISSQITLKVLIALFGQD